MEQRNQADAAGPFTDGGRRSGRLVTRDDGCRTPPLRLRGCRRASPQGQLGTCPAGCCGGGRSDPVTPPRFAIDRTGCSCLAPGLGACPSSGGRNVGRGYAGCGRRCARAVACSLGSRATAVAVAGIGVLSVTTLGWLWARNSRAETFSGIDALQLVAVIAAVGYVLANEAGIIGAPRMLTPRVRAVDIALVGSLLALAVLLLVIGDVEPVYVGVGLAVLIGIDAPLRRTVGRALDGLLLADMRDRTSIRATEEERARLARDLHDAPLQELAGVIQRLELVPEARGEGDRLRAVASQLRAVATDLHPPVLDDLGLVAALKFLGDHPPVGGSSAIEVSVEGQPGLRAEQRPPPDVELAAFRIIQEGLANALRHSGAQVVRVRGRVGRDHIFVVVEDDGWGMSSGTRLEALQRGRMGLDSMHTRAEAAGAVLRIQSVPGAGTTVEFEWRR